MANTLQSNSHQSGVTVVELLVVILVIAILAGFAIMQRGPANEQFARQNAARELKTAFERARFDSVKRRADGTTVPFANVYIEATQITLATDVNQDGAIDAGDLVVTPFAANITLAARTGLSIPLTVSFNRRGEPDVVDPVFVVCNGTPCDFDTDAADNANIVYVTATGTVNMMAGGSSVATFPTPTVQTVPGGTSIRTETFVSPSR